MAKRHMLTKRTIDALATDLPGGLRLYDGALTGFGIHILPSGRKSFFLEYTAPGPKRRRRRMKLGSYGEMTVAQARAEAMRMKADVAAGKDPLNARRARSLESDLARWVKEYERLGQMIENARALIEGDRCR